MGVSIAMPEKPLSSYIICTTPRSGSWMLCSLLAQTGVAGRPSEFFGPTLREEFRSNRNLAHAEKTRDYLARVIVASMSENRVFGMKLLANQTRQFVRRVTEHRSEPIHSLRDALEAALPRVRSICLTRENKAAQAISLYRGLMTGVWQRRAKAPVAEEESIPYDEYALQRCYQDIVASDAYWEGFFKTYGVEPLRLTYEALVADFERETRRVLQFLGLPTDMSIAPPQTVKLADETSREWERRFYTLDRLPDEPYLEPQRLWVPY